MKEKESKTVQLFREIQDGSKAAFEELFNLNYGRLVAFAQQYTKQGVSAEEITSELFAKLWLRRAKLSSVLNPEAYLYISVKNASLNLIRSNKKRAALFVEGDTDRYHTEIPEKYSTLEDRELLRLLDAAVDSLPQQRRIIFKLVKEDGLKADTVAQILGISKRTVENQLYKAVKSLAEAITGYLGYHPQSKFEKRQALSELSVLFFM